MGATSVASPSRSSDRFRSRCSSWRRGWCGPASAWIGSDRYEQENESYGLTTWNATVLAATLLAQHEGDATSASARKRIANLAIRESAQYLNNTPAVCRASYIDPKVFDRFNSGETVRGSLERIERRSDPGTFVDREEIEAAVIGLLED